MTEYCSEYWEIKKDLYYIIFFLAIKFEGPKCNVEPQWCVGHNWGVGPKGIGQKEY